MMIEAAAPEDQAAALRQVRESVARHDAARAERDEAIRRASALGLTRRRVAEAAALTAQRVQQILDAGPPLPTRENLTLHEAMRLVLEEHGGGWMTLHDLAQEISDRGLYVKRDGSPVAANQVRARAGRYPQDFERTTDRSGRVRLRR